MGRTTDVRAAVEKELNFDSKIDARNIKVVNLNADVTITGTVPSYPQYVEAAAAVRRVAGVTGVHNRLEVALPEKDYRDDSRLTTAANNALTQNVTVPDTVEADTKDGTITLTGHVHTWAEHHAVVGVARMAIGVVDVRDDLQVTG